VLQGVAIRFVAQLVDVIIVGKMLVKIKVVKKADHSPITYGEAAVRTILRIIDLIPFIAPYLLGAALIWASEHKQRLGDRIANTVVVQS
jgi:uncharacterized RDD family membrane protein YckC